MEGEAVGLSELRVRRWMPVRSLVLLAIHPQYSMRIKAIYQAMQKLGFQGSFIHARKEMTPMRNKEVFQPEPYRWALTATGQTLQNAIIRDMQEVLTLHKLRQGQLPAPKNAPWTVDESKYVVYRPNGSGAMVCVDCGSPLGHQHTPQCLHAMYAFGPHASRT